MAGFVAYMYQLGTVTPGTISGYVSHMNTLHRLGGRTAGARETPLADAALQGVYHRSDHVPNRVGALLPMALLLWAQSPDGIKARHATRKGELPTRDRMMFAMAALQLLGLLRFAEVGYVKKGAPLLRRDDVRFLEDGSVRVTLRRAKTAKLNGRQYTIVGNADVRMKELDVPTLLAEIIACLPLPNDAPLFAKDQHGKYAFSRKDMGVFVQRVVAASGARRYVSGDVKFSPHSWRAGGATALRAAGADIEEIQHAGRWLSFCFTIYTADREPELAANASRMTNSSRRVAAAER